ncbi:MAG: hypothetical protein IKA31_04385, partial [Clostridia bacterium]|nr:hypothetical protein [Clostridia bacterium]
MKNKFKKLIVCICFALIGCFTFSACSSTELKSNIESQIGSVTVSTMSLNDLKEMAVGKVALTSGRFDNQSYDKLKITGNTEQGDLINSITDAESSIQAEMLVRKSNNTRVFMVSDSANGAQSLAKLDNINDVRYMWEMFPSEKFTEYDNSIELYDILNSRFRINPYRSDLEKEFIKSIKLEGNTLTFTASFNSFDDRSEEYEDCYCYTEVAYVFDGDYLKSIEYSMYNYFYEPGTEYGKDSEEEILKDINGKPVVANGSISRAFYTKLGYNYEY